MSKPILWIREYHCGHERPTDVAFMLDDYRKPIVGHNGYCRVCMNESKIVEVRQAKLKMARLEGSP